MRNHRIFVLIVSALLMLPDGGWAELPETVWLNSYLSARRADWETLPRDAYRYVGGLDEDGTGKLRALLSKIATNSPEVNINDYVAANAALWLLGAARAPGLVETAIPLLQISRLSVDVTAAEAMGRSGSEAAVEPIEAAFRRNLKAQFDGKARVPDKTVPFMHALALNGTPKARAAFERARTQFLEAYKTNNIELSRVDRESLENLWSKVQNELAKETAERGIPNPENAKRVWPPKASNTAGENSLPPKEGRSASSPNPLAPVAAVNSATQRAHVPGRWTLWAGIATALVVIVAVVLKRRAH